MDVQRRELEGAQGGVELTHVTTGTGLDEGHLGLGLRSEVGDRRALGQLERLLGLAEGAVAVGHDRQVVRGAVHALGGTQLGERLGVVAGGVRRLPHGLAHDGDPRRTRSRGERVLVGRLRVLVDQHAGRGEVAGHAGGQLLGQALQLGRDRRGPARAR